MFPCPPVDRKLTRRLRIGLLEGDACDGAAGKEGDAQSCLSGLDGAWERRVAGPGALGPQHGRRPCPMRAGGSGGVICVCRGAGGGRGAALDAASGKNISMNHPEVMDSNKARPGPQRPRSRRKTRSVCASTRGRAVRALGSGRGHRGMGWGEGMGSGAVLQGPLGYPYVDT